MALPVYRTKDELKNYIQADSGCDDETWNEVWAMLTKFGLAEVIGLNSAGEELYARTLTGDFVLDGMQSGRL